MTLLSHLPLANVGMPGQTAMFLSTIASMLRFSLFGVDRRVSEYFGVDFEIRTTTELQRQAGYSSCYMLINLFALLSIIIVCGLVHAIARIVRSVSEYKPGMQPAPNGRTDVQYSSFTEKSLNAFLRLLLLSALELAICSLMNIVADTSQSNSSFQQISKALSDINNIESANIFFKSTT